jgi:hypothetical protein
VPSRKVGVVLVDDAHLDPRHLATEGASADLARSNIVGEDPHHLGHAPDLDERKAEAFFERGVKLRLDAGADGEAHRMAPLVLVGRAAEQQRHDHAEIVHDGRAGLPDLAPPQLRMEPVGLDLAIAGEHDAKERHDRGIHVIERQRVVEPLLGVAERREAAARHVPGARRKLVTVRQHAALGPAGGA